jgi:hypothetical protein
MDKGLPIRIEPVRGRLPRRYLVIDERTPAQKWRQVGWIFLACALASGLIWLRLR